MLSENSLKELKSRGCRKVLLQIPEGLKTKAQAMADILSREGMEAVVSVEPCFGSCDLRGNEAKALGCDAILHVGHSSLGLKADVPVIYEECRQDFDPVPLLEKHISQLPYKSICLVTTIQHIGSLENARALLEKKGKAVHIGRPDHAKYPGQILGCDHSAALSMEDKVECFLYIGSGLFHPLGLAEKTEKPVLFLDIESSELKDLSEERTKRQKIRAANLAKASMSENFGILVSTKPGQMNMKNAEKAKKALEAKEKRAWILAADLITPEKLLGLKIDCLVNCACPRMTEDVSLFKKPIITAEEAESL
jgi:2-(3-amino-3-carboxypropyl)histidine synthase